MTVLSPYGEKLISDFLRSHVDVVALGARVIGSATPKDLDRPWVKVTQLDAPKTQTFDHLVPFLFQLDCYATEDGGQPEANLLYRTVRAALDGFNGSYSEGVVTRTSIVGAARIPDTFMEPALERFILTVQVWAHP